MQIWSKKCLPSLLGRFLHMKQIIREQVSPYERPWDKVQAF